MSPSSQISRTNTSRNVTVNSCCLVMVRSAKRGKTYNSSVRYREPLLGPDTSCAHPLDHPLDIVLQGSHGSTWNDVDGSDHALGSCHEPTCATQQNDAHYRGTCPCRQSGIFEENQSTSRSNCE